LLLWRLEVEAEGLGRMERGARARKREQYY
jgi:hypothetical protein